MPTQVEPIKNKTSGSCLIPQSQKLTKQLRVCKIACPILFLTIGLYRYLKAFFLVVLHCSPVKVKLIYITLLRVDHRYEMIDQKRSVASILDVNPFAYKAARYLPERPMG